jgi:hypothetical protein
VYEDENVLLGGKLFALVGYQFPSNAFIELSRMSLNIKVKKEKIEKRLGNY